MFNVPTLINILIYTLIKHNVSITCERIINHAYETSHKNCNFLKSVTFL